MIDKIDIWVLKRKVATLSLRKVVPVYERWICSLKKEAQMGGLVLTEDPSASLSDGRHTYLTHTLGVSIIHCRSQR